MQLRILRVNAGWSGRFKPVQELVQGHVDCEGEGGETEGGPAGGRGHLLKTYVVELTPEERESVEALTRKGTVSARRMKRALVLLAAADGDTDPVIAKKARVHRATVERLRKRFVEEGLDAALSEHPRPGKERLLDGKQEAFLIALACSTPPEGRRSWTMQLLADRLVELDIVEGISDETVRRTLKKGRSSPGSARNGALRA